MTLARAEEDRGTGGHAGAMVVGARPTGSPSLSDDPAQEFARIADRVWGSGKVTAQPIEKGAQLGEPRP